MFSFIPKIELKSTINITKKIHIFLKIFRRFEYPAELARLTRINNTLQAGRLELFATVLNEKNLTKIEEKLIEYEFLLKEAFSAGLPLVQQDSELPQIKWTVLRAVFFSSTVLTTIGK